MSKEEEKKKWSESELEEFITKFFVSLFNQNIESLDNGNKKSKLLNQYIKDAKTENDNLKDAIEKSESKNRTLSVNLTQIRKSNESLKEINESLKNKYNILKKEKENLQNKYDSFKKEKENLQNKYDSLEKAKDELQNKYDNYREDLKNFDKVYELYKDTCEEREFFSKFINFENPMHFTSSILNEKNISNLYMYITYEMNSLNPKIFDLYNKILGFMCSVSKEFELIDCSDSMNDAYHVEINNKHSGKISRVIIYGYRYAVSGNTVKKALVEVK